MSKSLTKVKEHSKSITHNTVGSILADYFIKGVPTILGFIAALSSYFRGVPLWIVILIGTLIFFLLSVTWDRIGEKYRRWKSQTDGEPPAELQDVQPSMAAIESEVEKRIESLTAQHQSEKDGLQKQVERLQTNETALQMSIDSRDGELKQYEWLHNIAKEQANDIGRYVVAEIRYCYYELNAPIPHLILALDIYNKSVFDITIESEIVGHIKLAGERLRGEKELIHNPKIPPSGEESLTIKQRLTPEEGNLVAYCESQTLGAIYYFDALDIMIASRTEFPQFDRTPLNLPQHISSKDNPFTKEIDSLKAELEEEKARRTKPDITGKIKGVYYEWWANGELSNSKQMYFDYHFVVNIYLANLGTVTTIEQFKPVIKVGGRSYDGEREKDAHDVKEGEMNWREWGAGALDDLEKSNDAPLEHTRNGALWLVVKGVPKTEDESQMELELSVIDKDGTSYTLDTFPKSQWEKNPFLHKARVAEARAKMRREF